MAEKNKYLEAIIKRALGYEYEEVQTLIEETESGTKKKIVRVKKQMPPDIEAAKWLLKSKEAKKSTFKDLENEIRGVIDNGNSENKD